MTVAVIGGGMQGCSAALELSIRGSDVVLFERSSLLMHGASRWNEGKIHLGYIYANEGSLATAHTMIDGALVFHRRLRAYLEQEAPVAAASTEYTYGVHRDSLLSPDEVWHHITRVDSLIEDALAVAGSDYLGKRRISRSREVTDGSNPFDEMHIARAIRTPEMAVDTHSVADRVAARVHADPRISVVSDRRIERITSTDPKRYDLQDADGHWHGPFQAVVNATWESRLALDKTVGHAPNARWLNRYKLGLHVESLAGSEEIPSVTTVLGPFGDVVNFGRGRMYLSWYPVCLITATSDLAPPDPELGLDERARSSIAGQVIAELRSLVPALRSVAITPQDLVVRGGYIFAWGETDITDPRSRLHERHEVGVHSHGAYHSIDTGKYGLAPLHAVTVARRIVGDA